MYEAKNTARARVRIGFDGSVVKEYRAADARERFENEVKVLRYLEERGCDFVPRLIAADEEALRIVTTSVARGSSESAMKSSRKSTPSSKIMACSTMIRTCGTSLIGPATAGSV